MERCLSSRAAWHLGGPCFALILLACRREPAGPKDLSVAPAGRPAGAPTASGSPSVERPPPPAVDPTSHIYQVEQQELLGAREDGATLLFDRQRPQVALRTKTGCSVWSLGEDGYLGHAPVQSCADWLAPGGDPRAPDRSRELKVAEGALEVVPLTRPGFKLLLRGPALAPACRAVAMARWSPDSARIAVSCERDSHLYILDAGTGARAATLSLDPGERVQDLAWGKAGLVALVSPLVSPSDCHCHVDKRDLEKGNSAESEGDPEEGLPGDVCQKLLQECKTQEGPLPSWVKGSPCRRTAWTRLRPDKQQVAFACAGDSARYFTASVSAPTPTEHPEPILSESGVTPCWQSGALWLLGSFFDVWTRQSCDLEEANFSLGSLHVWSSLAARPRTLELRDPELSEGARLRSTFYLDPLGRYVLQELSWRSGSALRTYDVASFRQGPLGWTTYDNAQPAYSPEDSRWLPGRFPIWQTLEATSYLVSPKQQQAWRIYTAPGKRALVLIDLGETPMPPRTKVLDDGITVVAEPAAFDLGPPPAPPSDAGAKAATDPSGRFVATGKDSLRRLADGEELIFHEHGGARTARGVFEGPLDPISSLVFRIGDDPARGTLVRGDQLAPLLHHPNLIDDFFDGKPVAQPLLGAPLGRPPRLAEVSPAEVQPDGLLFHLQAEDGGDGAATIRRWVEDRPVGGALAIQAGQPVALRVPLPTTSCSRVRLYACNRLGLVCSKALLREHCPPGIKRPDMTAAER